MPHSCTHVYVHLVFATKYREPLIAEDFRWSVEAYMASVYANANQLLVAQYAMPDHYHGLFRMDIRKPLSDFIKVLKSSTTYMINKNILPGNFAWQNGYGLFSHSAGDLENVIRYIRSQPEHHAKTSFAQEVELLNKKYKGDWILED